MNEKTNIGYDFQNITKYNRGNLGGKRLDWANKPETYKIYPKSKKIQLEQPDLSVSIKFSDCINNRQSCRFFENKSLNIGQLSYLLWCSTGIQRVEQKYEFRTSPSAGALYPIESYIIANNVKGLPNGVYHYNIKYHCLEEIKQGDFSTISQSALLNQRMASEAPLVIFWSAVFGRTIWKYGARGYRYVYLDAGHVAAHFSLAAVDLGLGTCQIGALYDDEANKLLEIDGKTESVLYASVVGYPL